MPVFDLYAFGKGLARVAVYFGIFLFVASSAVVLVSIGESIVQIYVNAIKGIDSAVNNGSLPSCLGYFLHLLGLDIFLTSALSSVIGLALIWAGFVIQITVMTFAFNMKNLLGRAIQ